MCGARKTDGSGVCSKPPGWGTDHAGVGRCKFHGGSSPSGREHARRLRLVRAEAELATRLSEMGYEPIGNPLDAFADLVAQAVALKDWLAAKVDGLDDGVAGDESPAGLRFTDDRGGEQLRSEMALYERAMDRAAKLLAEWVRLGLDERRVQIDERLAALVADAVTAALSDPELGLTAEQAEVAPTVVARHLRLVPA